MFHTGDKLSRLFRESKDFFGFFLRATNVATIAKGVNQGKRKKALKMRFF